MINTDARIVKTLMRKHLTVKELHSAEQGKFYFAKSGDFIFPIHGKFAISINGLDIGGAVIADGMPVFDEVRIAHLLNILGKDGWYKCYFEK